MQYSILSKVEVKGNASELLQARYRPVALKCSFIIFSAAMGSMGMFLDASGDSSQLLVTNLWLAFFDSLGYLVLPFALDYFGRVKTHVFSFSMMGRGRHINRFGLLGKRLYVSLFCF